MSLGGIFIKMTVENVFFSWGSVIPADLLFVVFVLTVVVFIFVMSKFDGWLSDCLTDWLAENKTSLVCSLNPRNSRLDTPGAKWTHGSGGGGPTNPFTLLEL